MVPGTITELLLKYAQSGNNEVKECLEDLADKLSILTLQKLYELLMFENLNNLGVKLSHRLLEWLLFEYEIIYFHANDGGVWTLMEICRSEEKWECLPKAFSRYFTYGILIDYQLFGNFDFLEHRFPELYRIIRQDELLSSAIYAREYGTSIERDQSFPFTQYVLPENAKAWSGFSEIAKQEGFVELAALGDFYCKQTIEKLIALFDAIQDLPDKLRENFNRVLENQNLLLRKCAEAMVGGKRTEDSLAYYDNTYFQGIYEREQRIIEAFSKHDYAVLIELDAWNDFNGFSIGYDESWLPTVISKASEESCQKIMSFIGFRGHYKDLSDDLRCAILQRFPLAFHTPQGTFVAFIAFSQETTEMLARKSLSYPDFLPQTGTIFKDTTVIDTLNRIQALSALGGSYLNVYSLVPYIFIGTSHREFDHDVLCSLSKKAVDNLDTVKSLGNVCALCGVIFLILTGNVPNLRKTELFDELCGLMKEFPPFLFCRCIGHFSLEGKLLAHEAGMEAYRETEHEMRFYSISRHEILKSLEALPVDRRKLPTPGVPSCV